jgi:chloride channel protein, CIC family
VSPLQTSTRRRRVAEHLRIVLIAVVCGLGGGFCAIGFRELIHFVQDLFLGDPALWSGLFSGSFVFGAPEGTGVLGQAVPWWHRLVAPAIGGLFVGPLVYWVASEARGHGVPEVMEAVALRGGVIRPRVVGVKAVASALSIASGGSAGREGPIVQIGSAIGSTIGQLLRLPARQIRTLVGCGAAAGIAATFNAPIAGALFAAEVILGDFATAQFGPIVISSVVATVVSRAFLGNYPAFVVPDYQLVSPFELIPYMGIGVGAALVGVAFMLLLDFLEDFFEGLPTPGVFNPAFGGLAVGAIGAVLPQIFGNGYGSIAAALQGHLPLALLGALLVAKIVATSLTLGSGGSGGIFSPSLFLGAMTGGFFGTLVHQWFPAWTASSGAYALVTMGAVVATTTRAPITAIIMIFEMTQSIAIIPPLMAACVIATVVASFLHRDSIYTMKLVRRGIDLLADRDPNVLKTLFVRDVIDREPELLPASAPFTEVLDLVVRSRHSAFFVVDERGDLLGGISVAELRRLIFEQETLRHVVVAADLVESGRPTVTENDDLDTVMQILSHQGASELAVVDPGAPRRVVGAVHQADVVTAYNQEMLRRDLAGGMTSRVGLAERGQPVDLGGGYVLAQIEAPHHFVGKSLRDLDLRARTGIQVLLLRQPQGRSEAIRVPAPDDCVAEGDVLVIAGRAETVSRLAWS